MKTELAFVVTEDDLTNALFNGSSLDVRGSGSKSEARAQARLMLAAPRMLEACRSLLAMVEYCRQRGSFHEPKYDSSCPYEPTTEGMILSSASAAIAAAETKGTP